MIPKDLTRDIKSRLQSINGQITGLIKMLDENQAKGFTAHLAMKMHVQVS